MKKTILLAWLACATMVAKPAKNTLTPTEQLAATAKVWAFLKYYHPAVADGKYDWDRQLLSILPRVKQTQTKEELSAFLLGWINNLDEVKPCRKCQKEADKDYFDKNFDLGWIDDQSVFSEALSEKLHYIEANRHLGKSYYVKYFHKSVRNPEFTNEEPYKDADWKNENTRLLTLFRYWAKIEYFFPYKYQTDIPWDEVLTTMIPKFQDASSEEAFHLSMLELVAMVDDSHAMFVSGVTNNFFGYYWSPARFVYDDTNIVVTGAYNDSLAAIDDLRKGDVITSIDGKSVHSLFENRRKYMSGSNSASKEYMAYYMILNGQTDTAEITFTRDGKSLNKIIHRYHFRDFHYASDADKPTHKILEGNIGYIDLAVLKIKQVQDVMEELKDTKGLIIDIRNYPNGTLNALSRYFNTENNPFVKFIYPDLEYPGRYLWFDTYTTAKNGKYQYKGNVVLLVNNITQSHAEFTAMCLQTGKNVVTMGSQTSGADGNVSRFSMVGDYKTMISGIGVFYPDGTETQRVGVKVDIESKPTIAGMVAGKDEVLEDAKAYINQHAL